MHVACCLRSGVHYPPWIKSVYVSYQVHVTLESRPQLSLNAALPL